MEVIGLTESVIKYLRVHIIAGELKPGQKLNEAALSARLNISRGPLREAFRVLENENLVVGIPRKGSFVTDISMASCRDIFEARVMIESYSVDILQAKGIRSLPRVSSALEASVGLTRPKTDEPYEKYKYLRAIAEFHIRLVASSDNPLLNKFYSTIFSSLARYQSMYTFMPGLMKESEKEHRRILAAIQDGDYEKAKRLVRFHINKFISFIEQRFEKQKDVSGI